MSTTEVKFKIESEESHVDTHVQYGMRYPNGEIKWGSDRDDVMPLHSWMVTFQRLAEGERESRKNWNELLRQRAGRACVDLPTYRAQHHLVKRSLILSVTAPVSVTESEKVEP